MGELGAREDLPSDSRHIAATPYTEPRGSSEHKTKSNHRTLAPDRWGAYQRHDFNRPRLLPLPTHRKGLPRWLSGKSLRCGFDSWVRKIPGEGKWQPTAVSLPGEFHGQRSLVDYSPWGHKESDMAEHTHTQKSTKFLNWGYLVFFNLKKQKKIFICLLYLMKDVCSYCSMQTLH